MLSIIVVAHISRAFLMAFLQAMTSAVPVGAGGVVPPDMDYTVVVDPSTEHMMRLFFIL
jgi:hypothetical protein